MHPDEVYRLEYDAGLRGDYQRPMSHNLDNLTAWIMGYLDGLGDGGYEFERLEFLQFLSTNRRAGYNEVITRLGLDETANT